MRLGWRPRLVIALVAGLLISAAGPVLFLATGRMAIAWLMDPCIVFALNHMRLDGWARVWLWGGFIFNVALWAGLIWLLLRVLRRGRSKSAKAAA